jgi:predicted helicase
MTKIYHAHLYGSRQDKYRYLEEHDVTTVDWTELNPRSPFYLFIPQNTDLLSEYNQGYKITEIMPVNSVGIVTARDSLTILWSSQEVMDTVTDFAALPGEAARNKYNLGKDARDWKVELAQKDLNSSLIESDKVVSVLYRPFDARFTYYTGKTRGFICMPRSEVMRHMLNQDNLAFYTCRQTISESWQHILATSSIADDCYVSNKSRERGYLFPLYIYPDTQNQQGNLFVEKSSNLSSDFLTAIREKLGYLPTPEAIFYYIYAIFHSPSYRQRYAEFLKIDFPRVPLTSNDQLFKDLGAKGEELVNLHLMKSKKLNQLITKVGGEGDNAVTEVTYQAKAQRVYINKTRYFAGIAPELWQFKIGGYQVLDKWLKDRKKANRTLSFDEVLHYQKIVVALKETMQLMAEIDRLIPGFPIQ